MRITVDPEKYAILLDTSVAARDLEHSFIDYSFHFHLRKFFEVIPVQTSCQLSTKFWRRACIFLEVGDIDDGVDLV